MKLGSVSACGSLNNSPNFGMAVRKDAAKKIIGIITSDTMALDNKKIHNTLDAFKEFVKKQKDNIHVDIGLDDSGALTLYRAIPGGERIWCLERPGSRLQYSYFDDDGVLNMAYEGSKIDNKTGKLYPYRYSSFLRDLANTVDSATKQVRRELAIADGTENILDLCV